MGADPLKKDHEGLSPLHYVSHGSWPEAAVAELFASIRKYRPEILERAYAEMKEDLEGVKESMRTRSWRKKALDYSINGLIHLFALVGSYHLVRPWCCKKKREAGVLTSL